jgi:hypothetical protein
VISGAVDRGRPVISVLVSLPRLRLLRRLRLLVDTGSEHSIIHPGDGGALGLHYDRDFARAPSRAALGVGGTSHEFIEPCVLFLSHGSGILDEIPMTIGIAEPSRTNHDLPSLLGQDVLRYYRFTHQPSIGLVSLQRPDEL